MCRGATVNVGDGDVDDDVGGDDDDGDDDDDDIDH